MVKYHLIFEFLRKCLKHEKFFWELKWKIPKRVFSELFDEIRFEYFQKMQIVESLGDISKRVYFILEGEMLILKPNFIETNTKNFLAKLQKRNGFLLEIDEILNSKRVGRKLKDEEIIKKNFPEFELGDLLTKAGILGGRCIEKDEIRLFSIP